MLHSGKLLALFTNFRLGRGGGLVKDEHFILLKTFENNGRKKFYKIARRHGVNGIKFFFFVTDSSTKIARGFKKHSN